MSEFASSRLIDGTAKSLFDPLTKQNSKTFEILYCGVKKSVTGIKDANLKSDRNIFQRLVVAAEAGRKIDLVKLMKYELTSIPLSIANADGSLRPTEKSALGRILKCDKAMNVPPNSPQLKSCYIIDGMT